MKKLIFALFISIFVLAACKKNTTAKCTYVPSTIVASASEQSALQDSLTKYGIQATKDPSGFYYRVNNEGTGAKAKDLCTTIAAYYKIGYFAGPAFDSTASSPAVFLLGNVIPGWQKAIPLVGVNGNIDLYIPPSLGYGANDYTVGNITIPGGSYLVFNVVVSEIQ